MLTWLMVNLSTIIVGLAVLGIVAAVIVNMVKKKKKSGSTCGCGCSGCAMSDTCHKH